MLDLSKIQSMRSDVSGAHQITMTENEDAIMVRFVPSFGKRGRGGAYSSAFVGLSLRVTELMLDGNVKEAKKLLASVQ